MFRFVHQKLLLRSGIVITNEEHLKNTYLIWCIFRAFRQDRMRRMKTYKVFPFNLYCISESLSMADFLWTEFLTSVKLKDGDVDPPELPSTSGQKF